MNEDTVQCFYFSVSALAVSDWDALLQNINSTIDNLSKDYMWHKDKLKLVFPVLDSEKQEKIPPHLASSTCFGDNVEDEWFIVYLLLKLTDIHPNLVVQVSDNDGDFLLIEAADNLPGWVSPEKSENRIYIYNNKIHLIPPGVIDFTKQITVSEAIECLRKHSKDTEASPDIQNAINKRIGHYPDKITENLHRCIVTLPTEVAAVLNFDKSLISPIVHAYCNHDVIDLKACGSFRYSEYIDVSVIFTKCLFAMLLHAKPIKIKAPKELTAKTKRCELGLKILCGYKIITDTSQSNAFTHKSYNKYLKSLNVKGYFQGNLEGSREYKTLLAKANDFYLNTISPVNCNALDAITKIINSDTFSTHCEALKNSNHSKEVEDSEEWLNIHPDQLSELLNTRYGKQAKFNSMTPDTLSKELSNFLYKSSDFEGIETKNDEESDQIEFDPNEFADSINKMLNFISSGNEYDESDSDNLSEDDMNFKSDRVEELMDSEIKSSLLSDENKTETSKIILNNITQSLREEKAYLGPASNLIHNIGVSKTVILDSDDDDDKCD